MGLKKRVAECHPERKHRAKGLCGPCYYKVQDKYPTTVFATCHPNRKHIAKGLCDVCYRVSLRRTKGIKAKKTRINTKPLCHPDRLYYASDLCRRCFSNARYHNVVKIELGTNEELRLKNSLRRHHLSVLNFSQLMSSQDNNCGICGKPAPDEGRFEIDHDHNCCPGMTSCGKCIRGALCGYCNKLLMEAGDSIQILEKAIEYLKNYQKIKMRIV